ncbi:MAG: glycosyl hydrolase family 28-related protein [Balneolales bacterium]
MNYLKTGLLLLYVTACLPVSETGEDDTRISAGELWEAYIQDPDDHTHIPNVSYAGYRRSEVALPSEGVSFDVRDYGARGNGTSDDTDAFKEAIAAAGVNGGVINIPPGTYRLTDILHLNRDGIVLRGAGQEASTLLFDASLTDAIGHRRSGSGHATVWSWMGGMIWISPDDAFDGDGQPAGGESWRHTTTLAHLTQPASRGEAVVTVDDASALNDGDFILLTWDNPADLSLLLEMAGHPLMSRYDWSGSGSGLTNMAGWQWPVEIERVEGNQVTLAQPLRIDAKDSWNVRLQSPGPYVRGVGVEKLTIAFNTPQPVDQHLEDTGNNGIYLNRVIDCFVRDVTIHEAENGLIHAAAKQTTVHNLHISGSRMHHATALRVGSHDNLISDFVIETEVRHGINTEKLSTGNVWRRGVMHHGTFDSHRAMSWDLVRTDITVHNDGLPGGGSQAGPFLGRRVVHWNIRITNGKPDWIYQPEVISLGALVGVQGAAVSDRTSHAMPDGDKGHIIADPDQTPVPADLFEAQFRHRTGYAWPLD